MVKKGIFCLCMTVLILGGCTLGGVSLKGKEKLAEPDFVLTYAENQAEDYPTTQGAYKFAELVKERTGGKVEILVNAGGMLGDISLVKFSEPVEVVDIGTAEQSAHRLVETLE